MRIAAIFAAVILILAGGYVLSPHTPVSVEGLFSGEDEIVVEAVQPPTPQKVFNASETVLQNGMRVVVVPNYRAPVVTHMVWYKVGAAEERAGKSGIAHFLEHLLFKGSTVIGSQEPLAAGEFSRIIRGMGGNDNAFTSQDYTAYFQSVPADALERVMRMEAGRMKGALFAQKDVESERKVILEERRQRTDNDPRGRFGEQMQAAAYVNHPYGTPVIGWYHEMEALSLEDAYGFYREYYAPNNATLIVAGDVAPQKVFDLAAEIYGTLPANDDLADTDAWRVRTVSPKMHSETQVSLSHPAIREPVLQILYRVPSARQDKDASLALQVLQEILGGGPSARFYKRLVVEQKLAVSVGISYRANAWDDGSAWVYATPAPDVDVMDVKAALLAELQDVVTNGVTGTEVSEAVTRMRNEAIYARDSLSEPAMVIGLALSTGSRLDDVEYWPEEIGQVSAADVKAVAAKFLNPDVPIDTPPVVGVLLPEVSDE
ncbi:MAG: M16 family metallopeptidase [Alphaproteobacteria bacterium]